jgi:hypothetical protein
MNKDEDNEEKKEENSDEPKEKATEIEYKRSSSQGLRTHPPRDDEDIEE